jgi:hypothetical protein
MNWCNKQLISLMAQIRILKRSEGTNERNPYKEVLACYKKETSSWRKYWSTGLLEEYIL